MQNFKSLIQAGPRQKYRIFFERSAQALRESQGYAPVELRGHGKPGPDFDRTQRLPTGIACQTLFQACDLTCQSRAGSANIE